MPDTDTPTASVDRSAHDEQWLVRVVAQRLHSGVWGSWASLEDRIRQQYMGDARALLAGIRAEGCFVGRLPEPTDDQRRDGRVCWRQESGRLVYAENWDGEPWVTVAGVGDAASHHRAAALRVLAACARAEEMAAAANTDHQDAARIDAAQRREANPEDGVR